MAKQTAPLQANKLRKVAAQLKLDKWFHAFNVRKEKFDRRRYESRQHPFWSIVHKELADYIHSWRINILFAIIGLACLGSIYTAVMSLRDALSSEQGQNALESGYLFLQLFTIEGNGLPSFIGFISFLGPLLGIALGFDAINSEQSKGTLARMMAQPIPRDYVINAKFTAALFVIAVMFFTLGFLVMGFGTLIIGIPPTPEEFWRIVFFLIMGVAYVGFWLNLGILFSVRFKQAATSALASISVWLFFSVFFNMIVNLIVQAMVSTMQSVNALYGFTLNLMRISPSYLFTETTKTLLNPSVRSLGPLTQEQVVGAIPNSPLPLGQSLLLVWPQFTGMIALTTICFAISYVLFMRQEIRSR